MTFSQWIHDRRDLWNMLQTFRRGEMDKVKFFRPVDDLTALSARQRNTNLPLTSPYLRSDEIAEYNVIKSRAGSVLSAHTILKIDHWNTQGTVQSMLSGAPNFRQLARHNIYASAQPTLTAMRTIVGMMSQCDEGCTLMPVCWVNVREEPVIYIDDEPYVLRDRYATLRNIKSYSGINGRRLEQMESRLKEDILNEAATYHNRLLVHCESASQSIFPTWVNIEQESDVETLEEIFQRIKESFPGLVYCRLPMTAEEPPEPEDFDALLTLISQFKGRCHLVFNCQMGASRSTMGCVIAGLVINHLEGIQNEGQVVNKHSLLHYQTIHSILRVIPDGLMCKAIVDRLIDEAGAVVNLRDCIEKYRQAAATASDPNECRLALRKGIAALKRYALLILFQGYLVDVKAQGDETFVAWLDRHEEFRTLFQELDRKGNGVEVLNEQHAIEPCHGVACQSDVEEVVRHRRGQVLAPMTILKFDHFPGCQKISLTERIEGAPNFRQLTIADLGERIEDVISSEESLNENPFSYNYYESSSKSSMSSNGNGRSNDSISVYGLAMPTKQGLVNAIERIGKKSVFWCCLREEPVIYVKGRPYVLRIVKDPVNNLEMTGIVSERVELMEERLKMDTLAELELFNGKLLLHEEDASTGRIAPIWEVVHPDQVQTTAEVMEAVIKQGHYNIKYARVPMYMMDGLN